MGVHHAARLEVFLGVVNHGVVGHATVGQVHLTHRIETHLDPVAVDVAPRGQQSIQLATGHHLGTAGN